MVNGDILFPSSLLQRTCWDPIWVCITPNFQTMIAGLSPYWIGPLWLRNVIQLHSSANANTHSYRYIRRNGCVVVVIAIFVVNLHCTVICRNNTVRNLVVYCNHTFIVHLEFYYKCFKVKNTDNSHTCWLLAMLTLVISEFFGSSCLMCCFA